LGKTLAAFLLSIDDLVRAARAGELSDQVEMIYVSPLKALNNDVQENLGNAAGWNRRTRRRAGGFARDSCRRERQARGAPKRCAFERVSHHLAEPGLDCVLCFSLEVRLSDFLTI